MYMYMFQNMILEQEFITGKLTLFPSWAFCFCNIKTDIKFCEYIYYVHF